MNSTRTKTATKLVKFLIRKSVLQYYKLEYLFESYVRYFTHVALGGNTTSRIERFSSTNYTGPSPVASSKQRMALFAAFHTKGITPISNINYLKGLLLSGFRIIYIHNGKLSPQEISSLKPYCEQILCRTNIGQDFGSWKDGYLYLASKHLLLGIEWLLLCNDSNIFLGGQHAREFSNILDKELNETTCDVVALNKNYENRPHYQSYFLCFRASLFSSPRFIRFWKEYIPLSNRYHAIEKGEVALTRQIIEPATASILFDSPNLFQAISNKSLQYDELFKIMPINTLINLRKLYRAPTQAINNADLHYIFAFLDCHNPSHAYALLFIKYLKSPFLKKDLIRQDVFTLSQIVLLLRSEDIGGGRAFEEEILNVFANSGQKFSYLKNSREAFRKGIPGLYTKTFHGYGYNVSEKPSDFQP